MLLVGVSAGVSVTGAGSGGPVGDDNDVLM